MTNWVPGDGSHIANRDGVAWYQARRPFPWHRCKAQSRIWFERDGRVVYRCRCGGISEHEHASEWRRRFSR